MPTAASDPLARLLSALSAGSSARSASSSTLIVPEATRRAPLMPNNIPAGMKDAPHWVAHRAKRPINPKTGRAASVTDWTTWGTFDEAMARVQAGKVDGVGYAFTSDDGLIFIDLDDAIAEDGSVAEWARPVVDAAVHARAFVEVSPSGSGLHIVVRGKKGFTWANKPITNAAGEHIGAIEVYDSARYATVTGRLIDGASTALIDGAAIIEAARQTGERGVVVQLNVPGAPTASAHSGSNLDALSAGVYDPATARIQPRTSPVTLDIELAPRAPLELRKLVDALAYVDPGPYDSWLGGVHALAGVHEAGGEEERLAVAVAWAKTAPEKFDGEEAVIKAFNSHHARAGAITRASIYKAARSAGWQWDDHDEARERLAEVMEVRRASLGEFVLVVRTADRRSIVHLAPSEAAERIVFGELIRRGVKKPKPTMKAARDHIDAWIAAALSLPAIDVHVRVARTDGAIVHDLGSDDGQAITTRPGSVVVGPAPQDVLFLRDHANGCLPAPALDGLRDIQCAMQVLDEWYGFAGVPAGVRPLLTAWLVATLQPNIVTPILEVSGPPGSGKTILAAHIQQLIDPGATPGIRSARLRPEDIAAAAATFYTVSVDNVSRLSAEESDLLCQVTTGATLICRRLYEQRSTVTLSVKRPVILTSIAPVLVRSDAADRAVVVELPARRMRVDETEVNARFEAMRPRTLAAMHRVLAAAMSVRSDTSSSSQHRLAGFVRVGRAIALATGEEPATFDRAMDAMKRRQAAGALDDGSLGAAIFEVVQQHAQRAADGDFLPPTRENLRKQAEAASTIAQAVDGHRRAVLLTGEAMRRELLQALPEMVVRGAGIEIPRTARGLWEVLIRLTPTFQALGVHLRCDEFDKRHKVAVFVVDDQRAKSE